MEARRLAVNAGRGSLRPALALIFGDAAGDGGPGVDEPAREAAGIGALVGVVVGPQLLGGREPGRAEGEGRELGAQGGQLGEGGGSSR